MKSGSKLFVAAAAAVIAAVICAFPVAGRALEMKAGTAKAVITPAKPLGRITVNGPAAKGVRKDLYARALVLDDGTKKLVIVTYDLNCLDVATPILRSRCLHELGIAPEYLLLLATHDHAAPIQIVPANFDYGRWLAERIFALIQEAIANEQGPVTLRYGTGIGDYLMADPRYPDVYGPALKPIDQEVELLKVMRGDRTVALLFNQATHPMHDTFAYLDPAHPGYAMDEIEKSVPGALALYADACGGDQFMRRGAVMIAPLYVVKADAHKLASTVLKISAAPMQDVTGPIASSFQRIGLPLAPPVSYEEAQKLARHVPRDIGFVPYPDPRRETNWIRNLLKYYDQKIPFPTKTTDMACTDDGFLMPQLPEPREFPCIYEEAIVARIGPLALAALQGEVCAPIGLAIKNAVRSDHPIMLFAYMGEHNLYIPTKKLVQRDAYQAEVIKIQYASPVGWAPEVENEMVSNVLKMIHAIMND